jgi:hypothetical protein
MANLITAGNGTNNGLAVTSDNTGALNILTGSGSGTAAISIDSSQNVTIAGNATITGTITATGGVSGGIRSGTAVASTSGTSIDFTGIPSWVKRITVMFNGVSSNGSSNLLMQIGSGSFTTSGYLGSGTNSTTLTGTNYTTGFGSPLFNVSSAVIGGTIVLTQISGNTWIASGTLARTDGAAIGGVAGYITLGGTLDRIRITTVNGTDTFDAGTINIIYE